MPSINKHSLREEFESYQRRFDELSAEGKMNAEYRALFEGLILLLRLVISVFLEKNTQKNSKNSGKPPSQTDKDETSTNAGTHANTRRENGELAANSKTRESTKVAKVATCGHCAEDLTKVAPYRHERRTLIDIQFEKTVLHVDAEIKRCPVCEGSTKGRFPSVMKGPLQYGNGLKAYILNLLVAQMVSLSRVQKMIKALIGALISEATLLKYIIQMHQALETWEARSIEYLLNQPSMHVDETSLRVDKRNHWIHVYSAGDVTLKVLHRKRGGEAMEDINIIPRYGGTIIHDCWASYLSYDHCQHGLCGSHLLRELVFIIDSNHYAWASNMKKLLQEASAKVSKRKRKKLTQTEYANLQKRYRNILTRGEKEMPPIIKSQSGKRGRIAKSDAHNLWERLKQYEAAVLLFARESEVAFTNNRAEQDLRMSKVKQKVSGCFRKEIFAKAYCRISSYLQTMSNKGYNPLVAIQLAISGEHLQLMGE